MGGVLIKKSGKWGCFVNKWTFPQRRVHYVQYQYFFYLTFYLFGGVRTQPKHPAYGPVHLVRLGNVLYWTMRLRFVILMTDKWRVKRCIIIIIIIILYVCSDAVRRRQCVRVSWKCLALTLASWLFALATLAACLLGTQPCISLVHSSPAPKLLTIDRPCYITTTTSPV